MTTSELKQQIEKVLGNSIRCLLPSYWWKRLFHQVADRIDEAKEEVTNALEIPIVESEEALESLDLPMGKLATVARKKTYFSQCRQATEEEENDLSILLPLLPTEFTQVSSIGVKYTPLSDNVGFVAHLINITGSNHIYLVAGVNGCSAVVRDSEEVFDFYVSNQTSVNQNEVSRFNTFISNDKFYYVSVTYVKTGYSINDFFYINGDTATYIKGETSWERIAKESELTSSIIVNSIDELNALDVSQGTIASVVVHQGYGNFANCYQSSGEELVENLELETNRINEEYLNKLTRIYGVRLELPSEPFGETIETSVVQYNQDAVSSSDRVVIMSFISDGTLLGTYIKVFGSKVPVFKEDGSLNDEFFNETQLYYDYPAYHLETVGNGHLLSKVFVPIMDYSDVYVKGATWEKLAKESDCATIEDVGTSASGVEIREIYIYENLYDGTITELTDEQKAYNLETLELAKQGKAIVRATTKGTVYTLNLFIEKDDFQFGYVQPTGIVTGAVAISIAIGEDGLSCLKVEEKYPDSSLSTTSTSAVQNKVVTTSLNNKVDKEELNNAVETITNTIIENEEITATALNDLQSKIEDIYSKLNALGA